MISLARTVKKPKIPRGRIMMIQLTRVKSTDCRPEKKAMSTFCSRLSCGSFAMAMPTHTAMRRTDRTLADRNGAIALSGTTEVM